MGQWSSSESDQQQSLIEWAQYQENAIPELQLLYAIPNEGSGDNSSIGSRMVKQGLKSGIPDLCLPVPRGEYGALYIEMKYGNNDLRESQREKIEQLKEVGNAVAVAWSWHRAAEIIQEYLQGEFTEQVL